jgi:hypothetical protein
MQVNDKKNEKMVLSPGLAGGDYPCGCPFVGRVCPFIEKNWAGKLSAGSLHGNSIINEYENGMDIFGRFVDGLRSTLCNRSSDTSSGYGFEESSVVRHIFRACRRIGCSSFTFCQIK